jgi:hypothetical protein
MSGAISSTPQYACHTQLKKAQGLQATNLQLLVLIRTSPEMDFNVVIAFNVIISMYSTSVHLMNVTL